MWCPASAKAEWEMDHPLAFFVSKFGNSISKLVHTVFCYVNIISVTCTIIHFPLSLGNGQSPHGYINQRLQIQFRAPDDERCAAGNMLGLQ
jgi:hypothetical protein